MKLGVIGGSGVYAIKGAEVVAEHDISTPYGAPSDKIFELQTTPATNSEAPVPFVFLPRHGLGHRFLPTEINYRANIAALKKAGATHILAVSAVGILADGIHPGDLVVPDQLFDRTKGIRESTFFGNGIVGHVSFGDPFCQAFAGLTHESASAVTKELGAHTHCIRGGTYVCIEGPQFSTKAESVFYRRTLAATVVGMTAIPEAKLAREAGLHYSMLALATDYDCWNDSEGEVSTDAVVAVVKANSAKANKVILSVAENLNKLYRSKCHCAGASAHAVMTEKSRIPAEVMQRIIPILTR